MSRIWRILLAVLLLLAVAAVGGSWWAWSQWTGPGPGSADTSVVVEVPVGMTLLAAADTLEARGLLRDARVLLAGARLTGQTRSLRAGLYRLPGGRSPRDLLADLTSGRTVQIRVTLAEGLDAEQSAAVLADKLTFGAERFLVVADSLVRARAAAEGWLPIGRGVAWMDSLLAEPGPQVPRRLHWCEGYLAPDTYLFGAGADPLTVARHLIRTQWDRLDSALAVASAGPKVFHSPHELLTLASIVEAEARQANERTRIAAVYSNRLRQGRRLEADPTVAYLLHKRGRRMFFKDLEVASPYNTYRSGGLPPGPIGNPGLACLLAAARPDSTRELYFVSDGHGGHVFSRTLREHQEAVRRFRRAKAAERRRRGG
ncbi:aminodeoxychorismate lyase [bacterium DOLJORAL78_65_58]|nr:MAG: aminodeoxychorismate lyase [bacterium DOLZORAL124_64_63]PIE76311.1 MAG: aminodeoxychorismate lyase [bacterium DOLJORAL78_65_58]